MLTIHILNVDHGDSIVIEHTIPSGVVFGVIDSNQYNKQPPAALNKLQELGAKELSFVALTHPHKDHYKGLLDILEAYEGRVSTFYTFPLDHHRHGQLEKLAKIYQDVFKNSDSARVRSSLKEFVQISAICPPKRNKGPYFQMIEQAGYDIVAREDENDLSLAFLIQYKGKRLILGGDASEANWLYRKRIFSEHSGEKLDATAVKLPHHGAKNDCQPAIIDYLFSQNELRFACISSDGHFPHPHPSVLNTLEQKEIHPFCTNLADQCGNKVADLLVFESTIEAELLRYINSVAEMSRTGNKQPCQGDIKIQIDDDGTLSVTPEYNHPCPYRGDFDFILS